jgi:hypothetical protein
MRMHGPKVSVRDLDQRIAEKLPNAADGLPYSLPTEPAHYGATWKDNAPARESSLTVWAERCIYAIGVCVGLAFLAGVLL